MSPPPKDIVERIRGLRYVHVPVASELMNEAATAIETLRWQLKISENIIARLVTKNGRLEKSVEGHTCGITPDAQLKPPPITDIVSPQETSLPGQ
jgi:hypothetical protein